ncbi:TIGR03086 family metal-binding protein [Thermoactinospora rubra]|uniref:TIGR03086 family metal-binding protein n=1 Tax=Thermoactinospora rubra TaxID=1088767 RepID=UPI000A0FD9B5|nr:TIGR03086 family metal-binding protein [Thermoactinospora rubra]
MNAPDLHNRAMREFAARVHAVGPEQWTLPTPCLDWNVRTLVNHIVSENLWAPPLFAGLTVADVGDALDGDLLGDDPVKAFDDSAARAVAAVQAEGAMDRIVHLSFGDVPGSEYAMQLFADLLVHAWDLAEAIGADRRLDPELVEACSAWFAGQEEAYRSAGAIGPRLDVPPDADSQAKLLAAFGRRA